MEYNKGSAIILTIIIITVFATYTLYSRSYILINSQRDFLFSKYYERATASALSCREMAVARLSTDFLYRADGVKVPNYNCDYSIFTNSNYRDADIYVDIFAMGTTSVPRFIYPKNIMVSIKSTVKISHIAPTIIKTIFQ